MARKRQRRPLSAGLQLKHTDDNKQYVWSVVILVVFFSIVSAVASIFFVNLHYNNEVVNANTQASSDQAQLKSEETDVQFLIQHDSNQINCFDLVSSYARNVCNSHNQ